MSEIKITIEGPAKSGKSSLASYLQETLWRLGFSVNIEEELPLPKTVKENNNYFKSHKYTIVTKTTPK
jgi:deoxyadenosine/deoxycytidine kinase